MSPTEAENSRGFFFFFNTQLLTGDNNLLYRYLDITKGVFLW